jgi:hypothetical protein
MLLKIEAIINKYTDIDENDFTTNSKNEIFIMGQFYQWAEVFVNDDNADLNVMVEIPAKFTELF